MNAARYAVRWHDHGAPLECPFPAGVRLADLRAYCYHLQNRGYKRVRIVRVK